MRESTIEAWLVKRVHANGGEIRKVKWIGRRGAPDRRVMLPGLCVWIELKATGVAPEDYQLREHERMRRCGEDVRVIDSKAGVDELIEEYHLEMGE